MNIYYFCSILSAKQIQCSESCTCHYNQALDENVFMCTGPNIRNMPTSIPNNTDRIILTRTNITHLCISFPYFNQLSSLSIVSSRLTRICDDTLGDILNSQTLKQLDVSKNNIHHFSTVWMKKSRILDQIWLSGNPAECGCDMIWMADWLENATTRSGSRLVKDYRDLACSSQTKNGTPVYKLDKVNLGCYPTDKPLWIIVVASVISAFMLVVVTVVLTVHRYWRIVRWLVYKNFDKLIGDPDRCEDITTVHFEAFVSFRYARVWSLRLLDTYAAKPCKNQTPL